MTVRLLDSSNTVVNTTQTVADGTYQFTNVSPGTYRVEFVAPMGTAFTTQDQGGNDNLDSDADPTSGRTATFPVTAGSSDLSRDAGLVLPQVTVVASDPDASEVGPDSGAFTFTRSGGNTAQALTVYYTLGGNATCGAPGSSIGAPVYVRFVSIRIGKMNSDRIAIKREQPALRHAAAKGTTLDLQAAVAYPTSAGG